MHMCRVKGGGRCLHWKAARSSRRGQRVDWEVLVVLALSWEPFPAPHLAAQGVPVAVGTSGAPRGACGYSQFCRECFPGCYLPLTAGIPRISWPLLSISSPADTRTGLLLRYSLLGWLCVHHVSVSFPRGGPSV